MKKLNLLFAFCILLLNFAQSQAPNKFNYSGVARNAANQPISSVAIGIRISILQGSGTGTSVYAETHKPTTNTIGLFNLAIGEGTIQSGIMSAINWANGPFFIKVEMDVTGGANYTIVGITELISVPYAMHAQTAGSLIGGGSSGSFNHFIGEQFEGGIIFHLWKDNTGAEHGLIVDLNDLSTSQVWSNVDQTLIGPNAQSSWDGLSNSNAIVAQIGHTSSAALLCLNSTNGGKNDWYLPSIQELYMLWDNYYTITKSLIQINATQLSQKNYWSSSEENASYAWHMFFKGGTSNNNPKSNLAYVRAVRSF
jgi:hypothetical protein